MSPYVLVEHSHRERKNTLNTAVFSSQRIAGDVARFVLEEAMLPWLQFSSQAAAIPFFNGFPFPPPLFVGDKPVFFLNLDSGPRSCARIGQR